MESFIRQYITRSLYEGSSGPSLSDCLFDHFESPGSFVRLVIMDESSREDEAADEVFEEPTIPVFERFGLIGTGRPGRPGQELRRRRTTTTTTPRPQESECRKPCPVCKKEAEAPIPCYAAASDAKTTCSVCLEEKSMRDDPVMLRCMHPVCLPCFRRIGTY